MILKKMVLLASFVVVYALISCGKKAVDSGAISIVEPWVMEVPDVQKITAAFMKIKNPSESAEFLIGVSSDASKSAEMHQMLVENDVMKMRRIDSIEIPAGGEVELKRGGLHIMMIDLTKAIRSEDTVNVTLEFKNAGPITIPVTVKKLEENHANH
jgi:hypothetical protein